MHQAVAVLGVLPKLLNDGFQITVQHHGGIGTQVIKDGSCFFKEERQVVLDTRGCHGVAHVLVDAAFGGVTVEQFTPATSELGACSLVHGEFATWQQAHLRDRVQAALGIWIKGSDGVDLIVKQVDAIGHQ